MACSFAYLEDNCGCHIGYQLPLKDEDNNDISAYPLHVLNVNGVDLGEASGPSQYVSIWNGDTANQAVGTLSLGGGSFCFNLSRVSGVTPPSAVRGSVTEAPPVTNFNYDYGATAAVTTGDPLSEADYISSVADVFAADDEIPGTPKPHGAAKITINDFGNTDDAVLFIEVDGTEAPFTKWSVVGDPLQQDQPIDQSFTGSAVWFKTARAGRTLYITRAQTTFSGPVEFSR